MSIHAEKLRLRREALVAKSQAERMLLELQGKQLKESLSFAEVGLHFARQLTQRPVLGIGLAVAMLMVKPGKILSLLKKALSLWQIWQLVAPAFKKNQEATPPVQPE